LLTATLSHSDRVEDGVVPADGGPVLLVLRARVRHLVELGRGGQHGAAEPHREALHVVRDDVHLDGARLERPAALLFRAPNAVVDSAFDISAQPAPEVLEHGGAPRQHHRAVEPAPDVDGAALYGGVDHLGERRGVLAREYLRVEEDLRP